LSCVSDSFGKRVRRAIGLKHLLAVPIGQARIEVGKGQDAEADIVIVTLAFDDETPFSWFAVERDFSAVSRRSDYQRHAHEIAKSIGAIAKVTDSG
jgi:hypothetical protein